MNDERIFALAIGIVVGSLLFAALSQVAKDRQSRRAIAVASYGIGFLTTGYLQANTDILAQVTDQIVSQAIAVVLAAMATALAFWRWRV